ncbi:MAG: DUF4398 domain-containing protein [Deltaproteobacteria bacterium]|nr:DUF4398 domain-containing protein [Deltaproteobacteria bacterium]
MRLALALLPLVLSGCAARSAYTLLNADRALQKARQAGAEEKSAYEYTLASEYLAKAREENTYNEYQISERLAKTSMEYALRALENTSDAEREYDEEIVPEERIEVPKEEKKENTLDQIDLDEI